MEALSSKRLLFVSIPILTGICFFCFTLTARAIPFAEIYEKPDCLECTKLKRYLKFRNIGFISYDVSVPKIKRTFKRKYGPSPLPVTQIGNTVLKGFDKAKIDKLLSPVRSPVNGSPEENSYLYSYFLFCLRSLGLPLLLLFFLKKLLVFLTSSKKTGSQRFPDKISFSNHSDASYFLLEFGRENFRN